MMKSVFATSSMLLLVAVLSIILSTQLAPGTQILAAVAVSVFSFAAGLWTGAFSTVGRQARSAENLGMSQEFATVNRNAW